jgi:hypothetical protein
MISRLNLMTHGLGTLFENALPLLNQFAPTIGATLAGPPGFAAGYIIPLLAHAFSALPKNAKEISDAILADKDAASKLRDLEFNHAGILSALGDSISSLSKAEINVKLEWGSSEPVTTS